MKTGSCYGPGLRSPRTGRSATRSAKGVHGETASAVPGTAKAGRAGALLPAVASHAHRAATAPVVAHVRLEVAAGGVDRALAGDRTVALAVGAVAPAPVVLVVRREPARPGVPDHLRTGPAGAIDPPSAMGDEQPILGMCHSSFSARCFAAQPLVSSAYRSVPCPAVVTVRPPVAG